MSKQYPGGIISKTAPTPSGPFENSTAPGIWTLEQQLQYKQQGVWPIAGNSPNYIEDVFSTYLYTGTNPPTAAQTVVNGIDLAGKGGLVWIKPRNAVEAHILTDTVRGANNFLQSQDTAGNSAGTNWLTAFNSNGFTVGNNINAAIWNLVSWTFREQAKFFDVVTWTGTGSATTIAHNLGSVPGCIIVKQTNDVNNWAVYHRSLGNSSAVFLNLTNSSASSSNWNNTDPTSTVFSVGTGSNVNASGASYVAYLFAHDAGGFGLTGTDNVISCGSFTADSSGYATVNLGYEPQFLITKVVSAEGYSWRLLDTMRGWSQLGNDRFLTPNSSSAEGGDGFGTPTATGFEYGQTGANTQHIYIAIRRGPMKVPELGTSVFEPAFKNASAPRYSAPFVVDAGGDFSRSFTARFLSSRLTGTGRMSTAATTAEAADADTIWDYMNGWQGGSGSATTDSISWMFQRAPGFFDVVCYTGTGSATTFSHNLQAVPELMIVKKRSATDDWAVYAGDNTDFLLLNTTAATADDNTYWNDTSPTSTVFSVGTNADVNTSAATYVAYLFATCPGVSKVGSYTGTAATQIINCGFTGGARFVLIKRTDSTGDWYVWDSARGIIAGDDPYLLLNSTAAEVTNTDYVDTAATGFELTSTAPAAINASGGTYIFLAIA